MGFLQPRLPDIDLAEWSQGSRSQKIRPMAQHWAEVGFGTPVLLHLFYVAKILLYVLVGWLIVLTTKGIDGFTDAAAWYAEPIVFEKVVLYTAVRGDRAGLRLWAAEQPILPADGLDPVLDEVRHHPAAAVAGSSAVDPRHQAQAGGRCPLRTAGDDVAVGAVHRWRRPIPELGTTVGLLPAWQIVLILLLLGVLGLRDKVIFLAARGEVYATLTVTFLFGRLNGIDMIVAAKLVFLVIWIGAATSKLNRHFPFVISTMMSNNPLFRPRFIKRMFFKKFPGDLRPGLLSRIVAHVSTVIEMCVPVVLFVAHGGWPTVVAATIMVCFHLGILTAIPMGVPLEWNVFMIFGVLSLFVGHACLGLADVKNPVPLAILIAVVAGIVIAGNVFPRKISFLAAMRYYAGNWDTTLWCIKPSAEDKINRGIVAIASMPAAQLERFYGKDRAQIPMYLGYAFRAMNSHGRALFTLAHRAMAGHDEDDYVITDGERVCSTAVGWNFGDGHLHNEQLIAAMQQRCGFQPGEVRVVLLDAQPIHRQTQEYRLVDAATGEFERGYVRVADMVNRQPWDDDVPVHVLPG